MPEKSYNNCPNWAILFKPIFWITKFLAAKRNSIVGIFTSPPVTEVCSTWVSMCAKSNITVINVMVGKGQHPLAKKNFRKFLVSS